MKLPVLNLPRFNLRLKKEGDSVRIWDAIRGKWLRLTPEEWVRQNFICYLTEMKGYDTMLIRQEQEIRMNGLSMRADILIYNETGKPYIMVECKAPHIRIGEEVLGQISRYNVTLQLPVLILTNGIRHYCYRWNTDGSFSRLDEIPHRSGLFEI